MAALWVLCAAFALQIAATTEGMTARQMARAAQGKFSTPVHGVPDQTLSGASLRAGKLVDLRFSDRRPDAKQIPGGADPLMFIAGGSFGFSHVLDCAAALSFEPCLAPPVGHVHQARAPPAAPV